ncbi:PAS domain S-box protein [Nitratidesulfovibrio termitidis]|uniref:PAS domain S-box protein n=1 Tax=Nitratidesulfovibrio termitidis TaxID=42252 RepID=UPI000411C230|nr:PAS domain S-box protein [Nitratidesulfovibrio termitidis]
MDFINIGERTRNRWQQSLDTLARLLGIRAAAIMRRHPGGLSVLLSSNTAGNPLLPGMRIATMAGGTYCDAVIEAGQPVYVQNALDDPRWRDSPMVQAGFVAYLGYPLLLPDGQLYGTLCLLETRQWPVSEVHRGIVEDFHAQVEETLALAYENALFGAQQDTLPSAALTVNTHGQVVRVNRRFPKLWGIDADAPGLVGRPLAEVRTLLADRLSDPAAITSVLPDGEAGPATFSAPDAPGALAVPSRMPNGAGGHPVLLADGRVLRCTHRTLRGEYGRAWGRVWLFEDVTAEVRGQEALERSEERLKLALDAASEAHWDWNFETGELYCSPRYYEMLGYVPGEFECTHYALRDLMHPDDLGEVTTALCLPDPAVSDAVTTCGVGQFEVQFRLRTKDGGWKWMLARGRVLARRADGSPARVVGTHMDISAAVSQQLALGRSEELFRGIFSTASVGIVLLDRFGLLMRVNDACACMLGYGVDEMRGQHFSRFMHVDETPVAATTLTSLLDRTQSASRLQHRLRHKNGGYLWTDISASPLEGPDGEVEAALAIIVDINEQRAAQQAQEDSERRYRALFENAQVGIFRTRIADGRFLEANSRIIEMYGWTDRAEFMEKMRSTEWYVDPEARGRMVTTLLRRGEFRNMEVEMRRRDDSTVWFEYSGKLDGDTIIGVAQDVTQRRAAEAARQRSEAHYRLLFEAAADAIFLHDTEGRFLDVNEVACRRLGYTRSELLAMSPKKLDAEEFAEQVEDRIRQLREEGSLTFESAHRTRTGSVLPVEIHAKLLDFDGKPVVLSIARDITDRKRLEQALMREATTDPLTGIRNRRQFFADAEREMGRAVRYGHPLAVLMLDLDRFKRVNDRFGHHAGDAVLRGCVQACQQALRDTDILGRLGGEEFAAVLLETDMDDALAAAERLRRAVEEMDVPFSGQQLRCTVSIGLALRGAGDSALDDILRRADSALYAAKEAGRNRVMLARPVNGGVEDQNRRWSSGGVLRGDG